MSPPSCAAGCILSYGKEATMKRDVYVAATFAATLAALGAGSAILKRGVVQAATATAPRFEVDPLWPKPLPNHWLLGWTIGVWVDEQDYVWVVHRGAAGLHVNEKGL